jgi:excisionase family DNA binding protein
MDKATMMMTTLEVAEQLRLPVKAVLGLIRSGRLPATRISHRYLIPRRAVEDFVDAVYKKEDDHDHETIEGTTD